MIIKQQKLNPYSLYLSGVSSDVIDYKIGLVKQFNPDVIAIGSSRSMQLRSNFFKVKFVNLGGSVNSIPELDYVTSQLINLEHKPSIVLMFVDIWWFNEKYQNPHITYMPMNQPDYLTWSNMHLLRKAIVKNGVFIKKDNRLGFGAVYQNQGYDSSGSFHYVSLVTGESPSTDYRFQNTFMRIRTGTARFEHSDSYSTFGVSRFNEIVDRLLKSQMHVLVIFPPFANGVYKKMMASGKYPYIAALTKHINNTHPIYDFTNPNDVKETNDCEFIDGFHGGEIVYARMIKQITTKDNVLYNVSDFDYLSKLLYEHKGESSPETVAFYSNRKSEIDFLGLGCRKTQ